MRQAVGMIEVSAGGQGLHEVTREVVGWAEAQGIGEGLVTIFCRHTSCSLLIQENAAPAARRDLERYFSQVAPESADYEHDDEGPDDMPAHLRAALTQVQLSIPVIGAKLALGTWQGIYLCEHRERGGSRRLTVTVFGE